MTEVDIRNAAREALESASSESVFKATQAISKFMFQHGATPVVRDAVIRLCDARDRLSSSSDGAREIIDSLCREVGLFNYIQDDEGLPWADRLVVEACRGGRLNFTLHRDQKIALEIFKDMRFVALSAPTSFGKTSLIDLLIDDLGPRVVVFIVPTIALMDERRRRLTELFGERYLIVTQKSQVVDESARVIYVQTQERLLEREDIEEIDILVLDEFYKLDPRRKDGRYFSLNQALYKFEKISKKVILLGPFVRGVDMGRRDGGIRFYESDTSTVAVEVIDRSESKDRDKDLFGFLRKFAGEASLVYVKSPPSARNVAHELKTRGYNKVTEQAAALADWLANTYHPEWSVVAALRNGIALHHGQMPRSVSQVLTRMFNAGYVDVLICTSSLIEGVNTRAKNVIVYDKKIERRNLDHFTFRNIVGRSGRMGFHYIGRVVLFDKPPAEEQVSIEIPVYASSGKLDNRFLVQMADADLDASGRVRKNLLLKPTQIPPKILERYASFGIENIDKVRENILDALPEDKRLLIWSGYPDYKQLVATLELAWKHLTFDKGYLWTASRAAFYASRLGVSNGSYRRFLRDILEDVEEDERAETLDHAFSAIRTLEFWVPSVLGLIEALLLHFADTKALGAPNYQNYIAALESLFSNPLTRALDEFGLPAPLSSKILQRVRGVSSIEDAVQAVHMLKQASPLSDFLTPAERLVVDFFE